jgi:decaprenylphospho-beta-D-ribofuranose 2-oxidase
MEIGQFFKIGFRLGMLALCSCVTFTYGDVLNDTGKINNIEAYHVIPVFTQKDIVNGVAEARNMHLPISIMAVQHSQGGQTLVKNGITLNTLPYNRVIAFDLNKKQITVESGITWDALQHFINPYNLAVQVMQDSYIFSIGGSLSANVHGEDFRSGPIDNTIVSFHMILASGKRVLVSKNKNPQLWQATLGGYGALGVISDVTLQLTDNNQMHGQFYVTDIKHFVQFFKNEILPNRNLTFFYGRLDISPGKDFLREIYVITSTNTYELSTPIGLKNPEAMDFIITPIFNLSRHSDWGKFILWHLEKLVIKNKYGRSSASRNDIMRKAIHFAIDYQKKGHADWLQEYFIPLDQLPNFVSELHKIAKENNINLLNITIRYIPKDTHILLSYAKTDCFSVVLYFDQKISATEVQKAQAWTQQLINASLKNSGSYYLTYQNFATKQQLKSAYPNYKKFKLIKKKYDPQSIFINNFYQKYFN